MARRIRVVVMGAGGAAQVVHLPILKRLPEVEIAGIVDPEVSKTRTIAERFGITRVVASMEALAVETEFEAAVVCAPNHVHEACVLEALAHGCHVLCERPLAPTSAAAKRMIEAARAARRQLMVAMNLRFRYDMRVIKHFVASGELGEVFYVRSTWLNRRSRRPRRGWRRDRSLAGGGVLMDLGTQAIDLALWTLDFPEVKSVVALTHGGEEVEASAVLLMSLSTGTSVSVEVTWELAHEGDRHVLYVLGTGGSARSAPFEVQRSTESGILDVTPPLDRPPAELYRDSYRQEWAEFLRHARGEKPVEELDAQVQVMKVVEAGYRSAAEGRQVEV